MGKSPRRACHRSIRGYVRDIASDLVAWSIHQREAPISARERLASFAPSLAARGVIALVTCHRVELLTALAPEIEPRLWLVSAIGEAATPTTVRFGPNAVRHLFRLAAGLDSAIPGERQILGQLRRAYGEARDARLPATVCVALERALHLGRDLRNSTPLGSVTRSIGSLAVDELLRLLADPATATVLVVGAGEVGKLASRALARRVGRILVVSRTGHSAHTAAAQSGGEAIALDDVPAALAVADGVISAADTRGTVLTAERLGVRLARGPLAVVDIAMPRSLGDDARSLDGLRYRCVDDLTADVSLPPSVIAECERACERATEEFLRDRVARDAAPTIAALHAHAEELRRRQLERALSKLGHLSERDRGIVAALARALTGALMHEPTRALRAEPSRAEAARELFGIRR